MAYVMQVIFCGMNIDMINDNMKLWMINLGVVETKLTKNTKIVTGMDRTIIIKL